VLCRLAQDANDRRAVGLQMHNGARHRQQCPMIAFRLEKILSLIYLFNNDHAVEKVCL
jgi:hypothetical protein